MKEIGNTRLKTRKRNRERERERNSIKFIVLQMFINAVKYLQTNIVTVRTSYIAHAHGKYP